MQDLLPTEVNIKLLRLIYCKDLAWTGFASEHERVPYRHQCALTCMVHKISSWTRFRSDNLLDGWQQRVLCKPRSDIPGKTTVPMLGMSNIAIVKTV